MSWSKTIQEDMTIFSQPCYQLTETQVQMLIAYMLQNHRSVCISDATDKLAFMGLSVFTEIPHQLFKESIILFLFEGRVVNSNFLKIT